MYKLPQKAVFSNIKSINTLISRYLSSNNHYDIIIAGGGMVGTTLACALGTNKKLSDRKILLLEGSPEFQWIPRTEYSNRVSALSSGTKSLMESIGAWKYIEEVRYGPVKKMQVWDSLSDASITFNKDNLSEILAYIVENDLIIASVNKVIENCPNVTVQHEAKICDYKLPKLHEDTVEVKMENGDIYKCNLLLGADGVNSKVRKAMGVQYISWSYDQMGVVATLKLSEPTDNIVAWQRFLPTGPVALLPLNNEQTSLVWSTTPEHAKKLLKMPIEHFIDELNSSLWKQYPRNDVINTATKNLNQFLETFQLPSGTMKQFPPSFSSCAEKSRAAFPLGFGHSSNYISKCVALIGDAAHRIHPLAGQGVNLGFGDVECINKLLGEAVYKGQNIGSLIYLKQYETERQRHNLPLMLGVDGLQRLYSTEFMPVVLLRSLGLQMTQALGPIKNFFLNYASR